MKASLPTETTLWDFEQATSLSAINEFESKSSHGMMQMQSIQEEKPYIDSTTSSKEITGNFSTVFYIKKVYMCIKLANLVLEVFCCVSIVTVL